MKKCTHCRSENDNSAVYCHSCGKRFENIKPGQNKVDASTPSKNQKVCPACESPIKSTDVFCTHCGFNIKEFEDKLKNLAKTRKLEKITPPKSATKITEEAKDTTANQETVPLSKKDLEAQTTDKDKKVSDSNKTSDSTPNDSKKSEENDSKKTMVLPVVPPNEKQGEKKTTEANTNTTEPAKAPIPTKKPEKVQLDPAVPIEADEVGAAQDSANKSTVGSNTPTAKSTQQNTGSLQQPKFYDEENIDKGYERNNWIKGLGFVALILIFLGIIGFSGFSFMKQQNSKESQINDFLTLVSKKNASQLAKTLKTTDDALELTEDSILPLINYLDGNANTTKTIKDELLKSNKADNYSISLKKNGKQGLFFDHYDIYIAPVYYTALTNKIGTKVSLNGATTYTSTKEPETTTLGPLVPGTYKVLATYKPENSDEVSQEKSVDLVKTNRSKPIDLEFVSVAFTVRSNVDEADVYISNEKVGTLADGSYKVEPRLWNKDMTIQLKKELDSGTITTSSEKVNKDLYNTSKNDPTMTLNFDEASIGKIDDNSSKTTEDTSSSTVSSGTIGSAAAGNTNNAAGTTTGNAGTNNAGNTTNNSTTSGSATTGSSTNTSGNATTQETPVIAPPTTTGTAVNQQTMNTVANNLNSVYNEFSNLALIQNNYSKEAFANAYFNGDQSNPVFISMNDYLTWVRYRQTINDFQSVRFDLLILDVYDLGNNNYRVNYDITYNTYYPDGRPVRVQTFRYTNARITVTSSGQTIFTSMGDGGVKIYDNY